MHIFPFYLSVLPILTIVSRNKLGIITADLIFIQCMLNIYCIGAQSISQEPNLILANLTGGSDYWWIRETLNGWVEWNQVGGRVRKPWAGHWLSGRKCHTEHTTLSNWRHEAAMQSRHFVHSLLTDKICQCDPSWNHYAFVSLRKSKQKTHSFKLSCVTLIFGGKRENRPKDTAVNGKGSCFPTKWEYNMAAKT